MSVARAKRREVRLRLGIWWRLLLMTGMIYVTILSILDMVRAAGLPWRGGYLAVAVSLLPVETYISLRMIRRRELRGSDLSRFRLAEAVSLLVVLELLRFLWQGLPALGGRVERLFDFEFFFAAVVLLTYWSIASAMLRWLEEIEYQPQEKPPPVTSPEYDLWVSSRARHVQHTAAFQRVLAMFLAGGIFILVVAGLARVDPRAIIDFQRGTIRALIGHVLIYFILGLALVAEARLSLLHTRWQHEDVSISPTVARRWPVLVGGLLLISVLIALLLPVNYSVGLLEAVAYGINLIVSAVITLLYVLLYLLSLLLYPFQWLIGQARGGGNEPPPPRFEAPQQAAPAGPAPPLLDLLKTLLFWAVTIGIVAYALYNFAREHGADLNRLPLLRPLLRLLGALGNMFALLWRRARQAQRRLAIGLARRRRAAAAERARRRLLRLGGLSPRQLVQYYYLSTVHRAASAGFRRRPSQTPEEYSAGLARNLPDVHEDLSTLTSAFVEAKYSEHPVEQEQARGLRPYWQRVKEALRRWRQERKTPGGPG